LDLGFAGVNYFSPGYLETLKIPILHGRNFSAEDIRSEAAVAILSESMAHRYWPNENAIGRQFKLGPRAPLFEVIGITRDAMPAGLRETAPGGHLSFYYSAFAGDLFLPLSAKVPTLGASSLVVRVAGQPKTMIPLVTKTIQSLDANITVSAQVLREMMDAGLAPLFGVSLAASGLGLLASLLATMGIYGVMAYVVSRRTHEVGVRMALGAQKTDVLRLVIGDGMRVVLIGVCVGIVGALGLAQLLSSKLFGLSPHDPLSFIVVSGISVLAALLACYLPARRASKIEPMEALRYE
jgi:putative ABC transport system permease protein